MAEQKKTRKQMFALIAEVNADNPEIVEFCKHQLELIEKGAQRPRSKKINAETEALRETIKTLFENEVEEPMPAKVVAENATERLGYLISTQKAAAALRVLVKNGDVQSYKKGSKAAVYAPTWWDFEVNED